MKPPVFDYVAPGTVEEAVAALAGRDDAAILAGGQSLVPTLNFRIARPSLLIDLQRIPALRGIEIANGRIIVRAMTRHRELELDDAVHRANPLIRETLGHVAHIPIRNRGTVVGSLAHADAAAEMPALLTLLEGSVVARGPRGSRTIAADDYFQFHMTTSRAADEILTAAHFPVLAPRTGWCFREFTRRHGDYAVAGVGALVTLGADGRCDKVRLAACGVAVRPIRLAKAEAALTGRRPEPAALKATGKAAADHVTAPDDAHATTALRRQLVATLVERTLREAAIRAQGRMN